MALQVLFVCGPRHKCKACNVLLVTVHTIQPPRKVQYALHMKARYNEGKAFWPDLMHLAMSRFVNIQARSGMSAAPFSVSMLNVDLMQAL